MFHRMHDASGTMPKSLLVRGARQLLTLRGSEHPRRGAELKDLGLIEDGSVLIVDGLIHSVGPSRRIENLQEARHADLVIEAHGRVVMPGFVDSHTHLIGGPPRLTETEMRAAGATSNEIAQFSTGLPHAVRHVRSAPAKRLIREAQQLIARFVRHGTTTIEAKTGYGLDESSETKTIRVLEELNGKPVTVVPTFFGAHVTPPEYASPGAYLEFLQEELIPRIRRRRSVQFTDIDLETGGYSYQEAARYLISARAAGLKIKVHGAIRARGSEAELAVQHGAVSLDHLECLSDYDIAQLASSEVIGTLIPGVVFHLGLNGPAPARKLIESGAAVALSTGFDPAQSPTCSMPAAMSLAVQQYAMSAAELVSAATINGAHAVAQAHLVGSLESGKIGDVIIIDAGDYREIPYSFGVNLVSAVIKRGEVLCQNQDLPWDNES
jgi:imidazolonepropionase